MDQAMFAVKHLIDKFFGPAVWQEIQDKWKEAVAVEKSLIEKADKAASDVVKDFSGGTK